MKSPLKFSILLALAALVAAPVVSAADPAPATPPAAPDTDARPRPNMRGMMQHRLEFLTEKLTLTEAQRTQIKAIWKQSAEQGKAMRDDPANKDLSREERRAKREAMMKANRDQVRAVLTPEQQAIFDKLPAEGPGRPGGKKPKDE